MSNNKNIVKGNITNKEKWITLAPLAERVKIKQKKWLSKHAHEITVYDMDGNLLTPEEILE
jgi:hypothetical protein